MPRPQHLRLQPSTATAAVGAPAVLSPTRDAGVRVTRRRLGATLAAMCAALQLLAALDHGRGTLAPYDVSWRVSAALVVAMLVRGLPIGYFVAFALRRARPAVCWSAVTASVVGITIELLRWITFDRAALAAPAVLAIGASIGAALFVRVSDVLRARAGDDGSLLAIDLPLLGVAYVALPVVWAACGDAARGGATTWFVLLPALFGASIVGAVRASRGAAASGVSGLLPLVAWIALALAPLWRTHGPAAAAIALAALALGLAQHRLLGSGAFERRAEARAVRVALPLLVAHLIALALAPMSATLPDASWSHLVSAYVATGFALAALVGRRALNAADAWRRVRPIVVVLASSTAAVHAVVTPGAVLSRATGFAASALVMLLAASAGVALYDAHRHHVRAHHRARPVVRERPRLRLVRGGLASA